ncbi:Serine-protein kinase RsbW [Halomicronema hongdechloris C2206]|uniref:Serine-protein kinase RsbW n=1 Tax=Halomicronema hongdechloris C2206 TaxID=1641165 RepID=A0A1Z3HPI4_9CYAN|nr:ATP-binding protein [Halomicronema hongdechloris]ASC72213.1 Serine-protein kinase RsbW [Halomicronema hongdechloris C2206]
MKTELHIPSDPRFLMVVENWLLDALRVELAQQSDWPQVASRLRLALVEAYSNVVRHAHAEQPSLPTVMVLQVTDVAISLEVWDSGIGFDLSSSPEHLPAPSDCRDGGYGWLILCRLMDEVQYYRQVEGGRNCLRLTSFLKPTSLVPSLGHSGQ